MLVAARKLLHLHFLLLALALQQEIGQGFDLGDVSDVADLSDTQLTLQITAKSMHLERIAEFVPR